jgi:2-polyprenyl-3-methyl-5-hydroxy-6-metoxy-1,4-benzoquinol methylase
VKVVAQTELVIPENTSKNTHNVVAELVGDVADGKVVLDLPCGEGAFTKRMLESGANVFSADFLNILRIPLCRRHESETPVRRCNV